MKHFLNKVQSFSALSESLRYGETNGSKRYVAVIDEYQFRFIFNKEMNMYRISIRTVLTDEIRFMDQGKLNNHEEIDHTFGSIVEIMNMYQLV